MAALPSVEEDFNIVEYLSKQSQSLSSYMAAKHPEQLWMVDLQRFYFQMLDEAKAQGKPLVMVGPTIPVEMIYAMGGVPLLLDCFPTRLASEGDAIHKYIDLANEYLHDTSCALNRGDLGLVLSGHMPTPDVLVYASTPCDSGRAIYSAIADHYDCPSICIDTPFVEDERGYAYIADGLKYAVKFIEEHTGLTMEYDRLKETMELSNEAYRLLKEIGDTRKVKPCPLPSRFLVLNEFFGATTGTQELIDFLNTELAFAKAQIAAGRGAVRGEEKHRVVFMQNMPWFEVGILDWLEKEFGTVVTIDAFGYFNSWQIEDLSSEDAIYKGLAKRVLGQPMTHGSAGPVESNLGIIEEGITEYGSDLCFFAGHVGCKHTWAVSKLLADMAYDKYGVRTYAFDLDCVDQRYKSGEEVKEDLRRFMETLDN